MDWKKVYYLIIENARSRKREDYIKYENHHIIPRSVKGLDTEENLVLLTLREHFFCHVLLCDMYDQNTFERKKMLWAYSFMSGCGKYNSNEYMRLKEEVSSMQRENRVGKKLSEETKKKISIAHKGKIYTEEYKKKLSETMMGVNKGRIHSEETKKIYSESHKGIVQSEESKRKKSESNLGKHNKGSKRSEEDRLKMKEGHLNMTVEKRKEISNRLNEIQKIGKKFLIWNLKNPEEKFEFDCFSNAHKFANTNNLDKVMNGKIKQCKGWTGKWVEYDVGVEK